MRQYIQTFNWYCAINQTLNPSSSETMYFVIDACDGPDFYISLLLALPVSRQTLSSFMTISLKGDDRPS